MDNGTLVLNTATGAYRFNVEVAVTPEERAKGLMFRQALADDAGMLFLYDESQPIQMWMKNTYIPLDMVFIGADWRVNRVHERAKPFSLTPIPSDGPVIGIVELAAGTIRKTGIKKGDKVDYTPLQPGSAAIR
ncbi:DUF192 domain-containing protein [Methyloligella sp. GL2]|nr:DUF192 domain-containing protein [Methyloligella sp. GL2]